MIPLLITRQSAKNGTNSNLEVEPMFSWAILFLIIAVIAAALGFGGLAGTAAFAAKIVFVIGLILFVVSLIWGRRRP